MAGDRGVGCERVSDACVGTMDGKGLGNTNMDGGKTEKGLHRPVWMGTVACGMIASVAIGALKQRLVERR